MKKIFLLIVYIYICVGAKGQTNVYHPFPDSGAVWNVSIQGTQCSQCYQRSYYISGDTTINSISYHKINFANSQGATIPPWYSCYYFNASVSIQYAAAMRQDTSQ